MSSGFSRYWERNRDAIVLTALVLLSFLFMEMDSTELVRDVKNNVAKWFLKIEACISYFPRMAAVSRENKRLLRQVTQLSSDHVRIQEALIENNRLRELLNMKECVSYEFIPADVIGRGRGFVHLNMGSDAGCEKNMVLRNDAGLAGKLTTVGKTTSFGQLLTDPNARVSAIIQRSRVTGVVRWLYGNIFLLDAVSVNHDVKPGDVVMTSGYSRIYPKGIVIGRVFKIIPPEPGGLFQTIHLKSEVDFNTLEILVIQKEIVSNNEL